MKPTGTAGTLSIRFLGIKPPQVDNTPTTPTQATDAPRSIEAAEQAASAAAQAGGVAQPAAPTAHLGSFATANAAGGPKISNSPMRALIDAKASPSGPTKRFADMLFGMTIVDKAPDGIPHWTGAVSSTPLSQADQEVVNAAADAAVAAYVEEQFGDKYPGFADAIRTDARQFLAGHPLVLADACKSELSLGDKTRPQAAAMLAAIEFEETPEFKAMQAAARAGVELSSAVADALVIFEAADVDDHLVVAVEADTKLLVASCANPMRDTQIKFVAQKYLDTNRQPSTTQACAALATLMVLSPETRTPILAALGLQDTANASSTSVEVAPAVSPEVLQAAAETDEKLVNMLSGLGASSVKRVMGAGYSSDEAYTFIRETLEIAGAPSPKHVAKLITDGLMPADKINLLANISEDYARRDDIKTLLGEAKVAYPQLPEPVVTSEEFYDAGQAKLSDVERALFSTMRRAYSCTDLARAARGVRWTSTDAARFVVETLQRPRRESENFADLLAGLKHPQDKRLLVQIMVDGRPSRQDLKTHQQAVVAALTDAQAPTASSAVIYDAGHSKFTGLDRELFEAMHKGFDLTSLGRAVRFHSEWSTSAMHKKVRDTLERPNRESENYAAVVSALDAADKVQLMQAMVNANQRDDFPPLLAKLRAAAA